MLSTADRLGCINSYDKRGSVVFRVVKVLRSGRVQMNTLFPGTDAKKAVLYDVLYVPKLTCSLFSARAAVAKVKLSDLALIIAVSGMRMESVVEKGSLAHKLYKLH